MRNIAIALGSICIVLAAGGCQTVEFDDPALLGSAEAEPGIETLKEEEQANIEALEDYAVEEELKTVDIEKSVVYVEKPVYYPEEADAGEPVVLTGQEAAAESLRQALKSPQKFNGGLMSYDFNDNFVYEIYCQPYRTTDIMLEPGEVVLEMPFLSEWDVWEVAAGVSKQGGLDVQHFFLKPTLTRLTTSMIIITDRRVYHLLLKSFSDVHMAMVRWRYPNVLPFNLAGNGVHGINSSNSAISMVDASMLSFDYRMSYSIFKKPVWTPERVYDDGRKTYIVLPRIILHMEFPGLFNESNERINYRVSENMIIVDGLIEKVTLRLGKEKVTIKKKNYEEPVTPEVYAVESDSYAPTRAIPSGVIYRVETEEEE